MCTSSNIHLSTLTPPLRCGQDAKRHWLQRLAMNLSCPVSFAPKSAACAKNLMVWKNTTMVESGLKRPGCQAHNASVCLMTMNRVSCPSALLPSFPFLTYISQLVRLERAEAPKSRSTRFYERLVLLMGTWQSMQGGRLWV